MTFWNAWRTVAFIMMYAVIATSYPHGAPDSACITLIPDSHGPSTATGPSPYFVRLSSKTYSANQVITVTLHGALFKGFLFVGRRADNSSTDPVGHFQKPDTGTRLACTAFASGNGITQTNNTIQHSITFQWRAPSTNVGSINFFYTVVRGKAPSTKVTSSDYYAGLHSDTLSPAGFHLPIEEQHEERIEIKGDENKKSAEVLTFEEIIYRSKLRA